MSDCEEAKQSNMFPLTGNFAESSRRENLSVLLHCRPHLWFIYSFLCWKFKLLYFPPWPSTAMGIVLSCRPSLLAYLGVGLLTKKICAYSTWQEMRSLLLKVVVWATFPYSTSTESSCYPPPPPANPATLPPSPACNILLTADQIFACPHLLNCISCI